MCRSADSRDKRYRSSIYIEGEAGERIVVDTGPEFRLQALRAGITRLDALLLTHAHADHLHGIDDIRPLTYQEPLPLYASPAVLEEFEERFRYIVHPPRKRGGGLPRITLYEAAKITIGALNITPIPIKHGEMDIIGWKFSEGGREAVYLTDVSFVPEESFLQVKNAALIIIGSLRAEKHATHFSFEEALDFAVRSSAKEIYITHICHNHSHREIEAFCQNWQQNWQLKNEDKITERKIAPAFDTQIITV